MTTKHTPTHMDFDDGDGSLYEFDEAGNPIALFTADPECPLETFEEFKKKAAFIVKAVNCHDGLVEALEKMVAMIYEGTPEDEWSQIKCIARAALAKAKGDA